MLYESEIIQAKCKDQKESCCFGASIANRVCLILETHMPVLSQLMQKAKNPQAVAGVFLDYGRRIQARSVPSDPSYLKISVAVGQIEQWLENRYPSWLFDSSGNMVAIPQFRDEAAARTITDARIRQLPLSSTGLRLKELDRQRNGLGPQNEKMSREDMKIMM